MTFKANIKGMCVTTIHYCFVLASALSTSPHSRNNANGVVLHIKERQIGECNIIDRCKEGQRFPSAESWACFIFISYRVFFVLFCFK